MYLCLDCERIFDETKCYVEPHGLDYPPYETWNGCPYCSGMYVEAISCDLCGGWVTGEYVKLKDGAVICENCYDIRDVNDI